MIDFSELKGSFYFSKRSVVQIMTREVSISESTKSIA